MPHADPARRRAYDAARKRRERAGGWTKKRLDTRLTALQIETARDVCDLFNEAVAEVRTTGNSSLQLEAKLRTKLRAAEICLRVIEIRNLEGRITALEEQSK